MKTSRRFRGATAALMAIGAAASPALALKYAPSEHHLKADPSIPAWSPAPLKIEPEEEFNLVGADTMDEITLGWVKLFRQAYPELSVTMEARASTSGVPALTDGAADAAPVARECLPKERENFVKKFGYQPFAIRVATGSLGSLGKTAATVILVAKDNPIRGLTLPQLDAIYSTTRRLGHAPVVTWGDLGLTGEWAARPIHLYGLKSPNGIEQYFKYRVMDGGDYKTDIEIVKAQGFTHPFTVAAHDMGAQIGGLTYGMLANLTPEVKVVPIAEKEGDPFVMPTIETVYAHAYPLSRYIYLYANRPPGKPLEPKVKEFLKLVLSRQGQQIVAAEGVFMPLTPKVVREELAKLE
jgi:phosphate transport system substrate-binding protein